MRVHPGRRKPEGPASNHRRVPVLVSALAPGLRSVGPGGRAASERLSLLFGELNIAEVL